MYIRSVGRDVDKVMVVFEADSILQVGHGSIASIINYLSLLENEIKF